MCASTFPADGCHLTECEKATCLWGLTLLCVHLLPVQVNIEAATAAAFCQQRVQNFVCVTMSLLLSKPVHTACCFEVSCQLFKMSLFSSWFWTVGRCTGDSSALCMLHLLLLPMTVRVTKVMLSGCRICWDQFEDPESGIATYSYQIFQLSPPKFFSASESASLPSSYSSSFVPSSVSSSSSAPASASRKLLQTPVQTPTRTPVTPQITVDASTAPRAQLVSGLKLQYGYTYYAEVTATNNADLNTTTTSPNVVVTKDPNRGLLIAIVVLASIGVSMLLVACFTAFIVRRRYGRPLNTSCTLDTATLQKQDPLEVHFHHVLIDLTW